MKPATSSSRFVTATLSFGSRPKAGSEFGSSIVSTTSVDWSPSISGSSCPVTVTVRTSVQSPGRKVNEDGAALSSVPSSTDTRTTTCVPGAGWAPSSTVNVARRALPASSTDPLIAPPP